MNKIEEVKKEIEEYLVSARLSTDLEHARTALKWVLKLKPDADDALQVAALAHDIERAYQGEDKVDEKDFADYWEYKKVHASRGAEITVAILEKHGFDAEFVGKVKKLIINHEIGGYYEADILRDADSVSFFEENFDGFLQRYGKEESKFKADLMFNRMSEETKKFCRELYDKSLEKINNTN